MKHILVFIGLMTLVMPGIAQVTTPEFDMEFFINFSGISNSPPYPGSYGVADYGRTQPPLLQNTPPRTNCLDISLGLQATPDDAWILEKQADGSLSTVAEVTNLAEVFTDGYPALPPLTTNQVHSLIEGNWYVEVDFGDSSYIGNLAPQYAGGPHATVVIPEVMFPSVQNGYTVVTGSKGTAKFVLDGSACKDPYYLPMKYSWSLWEVYNGFALSIPIFPGTNMMETHVFAPGLYSIALQADDIIANGQPFYYNLRVATPGQASEAIIYNMQYWPTPKAQERVLTDILSLAASNFNKGNYGQGCFDLELFEFSVRASHLNSAMTSYLLQSAQAITDAVDQP